MDERQWLLATAYNTGTECLQCVHSANYNLGAGNLLIVPLSSSSMLDEAKRWFEASTVICRFVPGGKECAEKVCQIRLYVLSMALHWCILGTLN